MTQQEMENIEKENAIKELKNLQIDIGSSPDDLDNSPLYYALDWAIKQLEKTKWTPVSSPLNELPKNRRLYVTTRWGYIAILYWDMTEWSDENIARNTIAYMDYYELQPYIPETNNITCAECPYSDIYDWDQDADTGKAAPIYWCEKHKEMCDTDIECEIAKNKKF